MTRHALDQGQPATGPLIGCIADDFTGATDLAGLLRRSGMSVVQCFGLPTDATIVAGYDAVVIALKTRSIPAQDACKQSCDAARWLQAIAVQRIFFKYCSTFDSTRDGNIGPVAEALMDLLNVKQTIFCPAFPENGRTVYNGHLFVGDRLLSESGMQDHPLNPMTDANLVRVLAVQSRRDVGLLRVGQLDDSVQTSLAALPALVIADAINDEDLRSIANAAVDHKLVTGGSAIAGHIAGVLRERSGFQPTRQEQQPFVSGPAAVLSGSCSQATQQQVAVFAANHPVFHLDIAAAARGESIAAQAKAWISENIDQSPILIASSTDAETLARVRREVGREQAAEVAEQLLGELGAHLIGLGIRRLVVAGGETSGAVTQRLGIEAIRIGPEIAPGVPWTESISEPRIALALKSGNFGSKDFFQEAIDLLE